MATTIDYGSDYGTDSIDYQTTMAEDSPMAIDYDRLSRGKLCPLKATEPPDLAAILRVGAIKCRTDGEPPRVEYIGGQCDGPRCAWWDAMAERCAVLSLARNK